MAFGFSVGDFISALQLVGTVVGAIRDSGGSGAEYRELLGELHGLETALLRVKQLEFDQEQCHEYAALRQVAAQCRSTIDAFCAKTQKYQKHLRAGGSGSALADIVMKIHWRTCRKEDLARLKIDVAAHAQSIQVLLSALQITQVRSQSRKFNEQCKSLASAIQDGVNLAMERLSDGLHQGARILENTVAILRTNVQIFQMVCLIHTVVTRIPNQVDRQPPVFMIDALGKTAPFYLEFIRSAEALKAVLKINFKNIPSGMRKIEDNAFIIQDSATKRNVDLSGEWEMCFLPGQRVEMSMVFRCLRDGNTCPNCKLPRTETDATDLECASCGLTFGHIIEAENLSGGISSAHLVESLDTLSPIFPDSPTDPRLRDRTSAGSLSPDPSLSQEMEDIRFYRRIKLLARNRRMMRTCHALEHDETTTELPYLADLNTVDPSIIDKENFAQLLEMDEEPDGTVDREFSRSIHIQALETNEVCMQKATELIGALDLHGLLPLSVHWIESAATVGYIQVRDAAWDLHELVKPKETYYFSKISSTEAKMHQAPYSSMASRMPEADLRRRLENILTCVKGQCQAVEEVIKAFYKIES